MTDLSDDPIAPLPPLGVDDVPGWDHETDVLVVGLGAAGAAATIAAADIPDAPQILNIKLVPAAHTTNTFHISALWLEYKRKLLTA